MARRYRSRRRPSTTSLLALGAGAIGAALALAFAWGFLGAIGELAFLGMLARALAIGALLAWICKRTGFSRPRAAAAIAGAAVVLSIAGSQYFSYVDQRTETQQAAQELRSQRLGFGSDPAEIQAHYQATLASLTFSNHLRRYFGLQGPGRDGASNFMGPAFGIGLFSLELVIAMLVAMYLPTGQASEPVCDTCGEWLREDVPMHCQYGHGKRLVDLLLAGECERAAEELVPPDTREHLQVTLASCPQQHAGDAGVLRLREHFIARRGRHMRTRHLADVQLAPAERSCLDAAFARLA